MSIPDGNSNYANMYFNNTLKNIGVAPYNIGTIGAYNPGTTQAYSYGDWTQKFAQMQSGLSTEPMTFEQYIKLKTLNDLDMLKGGIQKKPEWVTKYLEPLNMGIQAFSTLGNLYLGFKQYDIAKQQLGMAKEQWAMTKDELNRIRATREKLTREYMGE